MPFGLCNAPSKFHTMIAAVLGSYMDEFCVAYLDDILIYRKTAEEHKDHLQKIFHYFAKNNLFVKPYKCEFFQSEVGFLGFQVLRS